ncbi:hypothetical protein P879_00253 [Paragonimus westermani]|uniref:Cas1p 10 TM acyl transferase domain-containing protein n=1 Tax=Paragonimus westermani TaxID=34504 RepID=A0A8T0DXH6_9TREM|nr:hypothetical protein P879_00253 [Paragonimus westermani]
MVMSLFLISAYVASRNSIAYLFPTYSDALCRVGAISAELFVAHHHIWLAADLFGILMPIPDYPILSTTMTTWILMCVCHEMHQLTNELYPFILPHTPAEIPWKIFMFVLLYLFLNTDYY